MTPTTNNVETLQTQVDQVAKDLADLKKLTDESLKHTKAEAAADKLKTTKEAINKKIEALKGLTDATSKADVLKLEAMLKTLESSDTELETLKAGIVADKNTTTPVEKNTEVSTTATTETTEENPEEKKNRFKRQRDGFSDSTEENHTRKNVGRVAMGVGAGVLVYKGLKWLFGGGKKKEKKEAKDGEDNDSEEKGFWEKPFGKFLKWTGIGTGAYYLIHGLKTGRWGLSDFFNWDKKEKINPNDLKSRYEKEVPEALKPKYEKFAGMVDDYWKASGNTETLGKLENKEGAAVEIPRGAIPASMDNAYDNVGAILDTSGDILDKRGRVGGKLRGLVTEAGSKVVGGLFRGAVGLVKGLTAAMFDSNGEPNEKFKERAETEDLTRDEQVSNLLQKYSMVTSYLNDKRKQLTRKYTIDQLKTEGVSNPTEEQIEEYELNKDLVEMRVEKDFLSKKIASLETKDSAVDALETAGVLDATVSVETQAVLDEVKTIKKEIVPDETIWTRAKASADINKDEALKSELNGVSTRFSAHLKDGILERNILEGIANARGILNIDELWNSKADDLEEAMEKLGFSDEVKKYKLQNSEFYSKLQSGKLTKADIEAFEATINGYFSLLQQVMLETQTQQENEGARERKTWFMGRLYFLTMTPTGWAISIGLVVNSRWKKIFPTAKKTPVGFALDRGTKPVKWVYRTPMRKVNVPTILGNKVLKNSCYANTETGYNNFAKDFERGRMSYDDASYVYGKKITQKENVRKKANNSDLFESWVKEKYSLTKDQLTILKTHLENKNMRKILNDGTTTMVDLTKKLKIYEDAIAAITDVDKANAIRKLFESSNFSKLSDIDNIVKNIDKIDGDALAKLSDTEIKSLGKNISELTSADKINAKIVEIKKTASTATDVVKNLSVEQKKVYDLIADDISQLTKANESLKKVPGYVAGNATEVSNKAKIVKMEDWQLKLKNFDASELDAFAALRKFEFKSNHIIEIFELKKVAAVEKELKKLENGAADVSGLLRQLKSSKAAGADISESLIKTLDDIHTKNLLKSADEVAEFARDLFKIIAKIS